MKIYSLYRPFLRLFRTRRMSDFWTRFQISPRTRVLDVGGDPFNWSLLPNQPKLVFANVYILKGHTEGWVIADARNLPFSDGSFDVVYSNSVIEHMGGRKNQRLMANESRRVGRHYYVQTPNRYFPVELHLLTPLIHYLPKHMQKRLLRNFTVWGWVTRPTRQQCQEFLEEVNLLDENDLRCLFPEADIWRERLMGVTKSLIAAKSKPLPSRDADGFARSAQPEDGVSMRMLDGA